MRVRLPMSEGHREYKKSKKEAAANLEYRSVSVRRIF